jgi:hypothetical protein
MASKDFTIVPIHQIDLPAGIVSRSTPQLFRPSYEHPSFPYARFVKYIQRSREGRPFLRMLPCSQCTRVSVDVGRRFRIDSTTHIAFLKDPVIVVNSGCEIGRCVDDSHFIHRSRLPG